MIGEGMLSRIKSGVERELCKIGDEFKRPPLNAIPEQFGSAIDQFVRRKGKRLRSVLFVVGYRGYTAKKVKNLYKSAASLELLHDFILIHDDLIDHASLRRGSPSMHASLDTLLDGKNGLRFKGNDLALIVGDMMYAMAIQAFLAISENPVRKQRALSILTETALFTGCGELDELLHTLKPLADVGPKDIYRIYDWKTGHYSFTSPLAMGATLAGVSSKDLKTFMQVGTDLGRAFQIRDDLLDLYGDGDRFGKPGLLDLQEGKKTLPVWYAYEHSSSRDQARMRKVLERPGATKTQIKDIAKLIDASGAADFAEQEMKRFVTASVKRLRKTGMRENYREFLIEFVSDMLQPPSRQ
jgi:geranylgeranyl diphosphate synthase type I